MGFPGSPCYHLLYVDSYVISSGEELIFINSLLENESVPGKTPPK
jgi:hypothetical protein